MNINIIDLKKHSDERGYLFEILRNSGQMPRDKFGLIYFNSVRPGFTKANHYHRRKTEWYCVIKGTARVVLFDRKTGERREVMLNSESPQVLMINADVAHNITNVGFGEMQFIGYIDEPYDEKDPDTFQQVL